jgi:hypothetical protein
MKTKSYEISIEGSSNKYVYIVVPGSQTDKFIQELSASNTIRVVELDSSISESHRKLGEIYETTISS